MNNNILHIEDRKTRNWTALKPVRVACFVLIIALAFVSLNRFVAIDNRVSDTGLGVGIITSDLLPEQHFLHRNMHNVVHFANTVLRFESEQSIRAGNHLIWVRSPEAWHYPAVDSDASQGIPMPPDEFFDEAADRPADRDAFEDAWVELGEDEVYRRSVIEHNLELAELFREERRFVTSWVNELMTPDGSRVYAEFGGDVSVHIREVAEQSAINEQIHEFRMAMSFLEETEGLRYHISDMRGNVVSNVAADLDWIRSQPAYLIMENGTVIDSSHFSPEDINVLSQGRWVNRIIDSEIIMEAGMSLNIPRFEISDPGVDFRDIIHFTPMENIIERNAATIYLAFTSEAFSTYAAMFSATREAYIRDFAIIASAVVFAFALFSLLMVGAGRRFAVSKAEGVHFSGIDKPFLDISLVFVAFWCFVCLFVSIVFIEDMWRHAWLHRNHVVINILFAVLSIAVVTPVLIWFMSFAKRVKAGKFWRHTLIYYLPRKIVALLKPVWQGFKLMPKVALISVAAFFVLLFVGIVGDVSRSGFAVFIFTFFVTAVIAFLLTRYALRLYALEQAARKTGEGEYGEDIDVGGGELGSIANSINNISAVINAEVEQRMKSERLKTELITNVSHDIRTPLTSIITYTDLLKNEGLHSEKAPEYLDILISKSQRLKTLTDELFEAAKASTGNIDVNITEIDIVSLINQVLGELDSTVKSSGLDLRLNLPESMHVKADGKLMWRVLENLLSNVFKYSLPNSRVYIDVLEDRPFVRVDIKNISSDELNIDPAELMDRFKRGDDSRADGGSGLGLSIVQSFVTAQGGKFEIAIDGDLFKASVFLGS